MNINLLDLLKSEVGSQGIGTQKAFDSVLPSVLGGLMSKAATPNGGGAIMDMLSGGNNNGSIFNNLLGLLGSGDKIKSLLDMGAPLLNSLFGNRLGSIVDLVAGASGVSKSSSGSLLSLAMPLILGMLGKQKSALGLDAGGLMKLLFSQKDYVKAAAPAGLASALGISSFDSLSDSVSGAVRTASHNVERTVNTTVRETEKASSGGGFGKFLPWLLLLALLGLLWWMLKGCGGEKAVDATKDAVGTAVETTKDAAATTVDAAKDAAATTATAVDSAASAVSTTVNSAWAALGNFFKTKLPNGVELNIPEKGVENKLIKFIEDKNAAVSKDLWFSFDRLLFDTGKSTLKPESQEQVAHRIAVLIFALLKNNQEIELFSF